MDATNAQHATQTYDCRFPGCTGEAKSNRGPHAYLCDDHKGERPVAAPKSNGGGHAKGGGFESQVRELAALGRAADKAHAKYEDALSRARTAKEKAEEARRGYQTALRDALNTEAA